MKIVVARALLASVALASATAVPAQETQVRIDTGPVAGSAADGVLSWKGIPFAQPPVGELRWRAPQPVTPWQAVRNTRQYSADCMQKPFPSDAAPLGTTPAEDCLYANVWRPAGGADKLPVMVWIYGGGFVNGGASPPTYAGDNLARQGVVFVSFNYRVGRFGTFAFPALTAANADGGMLGNYGTMDQIAALKWVQRNIAAFGGDPSNVTIIGESAGGMSVHHLLTSPQSRGLFAKAVIMSGGDGTSTGGKTLADAEQAGANFARRHDIDPAAPDALQRLRALTAEQVTDGLNLMERGTGPETYVGPFVDGKLLVDLEKAYAADQFNRVPVMVGATSADIGGKSGFMIAGASNVADMLADKGVPVHEYRFSYVADSIGQPGAQHAAEIPYFFDNTAIKYGADTTAKDAAVGKMVSRYIVNFVKTGDPNGTGLTVWPKHSRAGDEIIDFAAEGRAVAGRDPWGAEISDEQQRMKAAMASGKYNSLTTSIGVLLDDPAAKAVLTRHLPQFVAGAQVDMARGITLEALHGYAPAMATREKLTAIDAELATLTPAT
ncbi:carboxylesterase/lipase family protein [Sphingomonas sp.]|uniref:carboxylesterase/lipase family protein n=1 Tax=Sphingomonas sp. TaxID=28214 RepID=UPI002B64154D|nr:carboxylesterase family protein [Sphingomonas sp.]HTG38018.1 carboxylesterase family protein [Sphingomonas sp.]